jgi:hypothetical protein
MTTRIENYNIGPIQKIININGQLTNFKLDYIVKCKNEIKPFNIAFVDQNSDNIVWKVVSDGSLKGSYEYDKDVFTNHYIYLKSDDELNVEVTLNVFPLDNEFSFYKNKYFIGFFVLLVCILIYFLWPKIKKSPKDKEDSYDNKLNYKFGF